MKPLTLKEKKGLATIMATALKLHEQLQKSSYYQREQNYILDEDAFEDEPEDYLLELLGSLNQSLYLTMNQYVKQIKE